MASEPGIVSTSKSTQTMNIDTDREQSTQSQAQSENEKPYKNQRVKHGPFGSNELPQPLSVSNRPVYFEKLRRILFTLGT